VAASAFCGAAVVAAIASAPAGCELLVGIPNPTLSPDCTALLCDGFESPTLNPVWIPNTSPGSPDAGGVTSSIVIDSLQVHSGRSALHLSVGPVPSSATGQAFLAESKTLSLTPTSSYARAWFYVARTVEVPIVLMYYAQAVSPYAGMYIELGGSGGPGALRLMDAKDQVTDLSKTVPVAAWFCIEWQVEFDSDSSPGLVRVWVDDGSGAGEQEVTGFNRVQATRPTPAFVYFDLGALVYPPNTTTSAIDIWVDDVAVDAQRIQCQ
jgi:hypothetical protein